MRSFGRYQVISPHQGDPLGEYIQNIVLDTCVAVDLQHFYFGTAKVDRESLKDLLLAFPFPKLRSKTVDINYGWATSEAAWNRSSQFDPVAARQIRYAVGEIVQWDPERVEMEFEKRYPPVSRDKKWPSKVPLPVASDVPNIYPLLVATYGMMLKILHLENTRSQWRNRGPEWAIKELYTWMRDDLAVVTSYEFGVAVDMFLAKNKRRNSARKLFNYGGPEEAERLADMAWNAAWDCWFTRLPEGMTYGLLAGISRPQSTALVTANKDPQYLRLVSELRSIIDTGSNQIPMNLNIWDETVSYSDELHTLMTSQRELEVLERFQRDPVAMLADAIRTVDRLEYSMGVRGRTLSCYQAAGCDSEFIRELGHADFDPQD